MLKTITPDPLSIEEGYLPNESPAKEYVLVNKDLVEEEEVVIPKLLEEEFLYQLNCICCNGEMNVVAQKIGEHNEILGEVYVCPKDDFTITLERKQCKNS